MSPLPHLPLHTLSLGGGLLFLLAGCGGGGGSGGGSPGPTGIELEKPGGGTFFLDPHTGGAASRFHLIEGVWGRLVDIHGLEPGGETTAEPAFRDFLINEAIQSDDLDYLLETNAITQRTRLVVLRVRGVVDPGNDFDALLRRAASGLSPIVPRSDAPSAGGPASLVARNACLSLRFDDLLEDGSNARLTLSDAVRVLTGYPPDRSFVARLFFDANHGGIAGGKFHSTRILIDTTVSDEEAAGAEFPLPVNSLGLPTSLLADSRPNVSVRIPSRPDPGTGLFGVLSNVSGSPMDMSGNGPVDQSSPTQDVVRAFRSGRGDDGNNGFLLDLNRPELIGSWPIRIEESDFVSGVSGFDVEVDLLFTGVCRRALRVGDIVQSGSLFLEVLADSQAPTLAGEVDDVLLSPVGGEPLASASLLLGGASYLSTFAGGLPIPQTCWVDVTPRPGLPPDMGLGSSSRFVVRFSEPMDPASVDPFESFRLVRGNSGSPVLPTTVVVGQAMSSGDLRTFTLQPLLPLSQGLTGEYHLDLARGAGMLTDLAGNPVPAIPTGMEFTLAADQNPPESRGVVLLFSAVDELEPTGTPDLRGQFFYDFERGTIRGRPPVFEGFAADQSQPVPGIMIPFAPGVQTPLSGLGSRLQTLWRYCDLGWTAEDETKHNLDVTGLAWTPVGGTVLNDFFERFELRLAHSRRLPDEHRTFTGTTYPCSGLGAGINICTPCLTNVPYDDNILRDPRSPQKVVHDRSLGYRIDARDLFLGASGVPLMPYPLNRSGGPFTSFTWRDTAVLNKDGIDSGGIPLTIETAAPLNIVPGPAGRIAGPRNVPAWGLPLLIEVRCFPSSTALGFNPLEIYLAQNAQQLPIFRAFTTGGVDQSGVTVEVNPDLALFPQGGYNPGSRPPGKQTLFQADNSFYSGQLDTVVRVSRAHTVWIPAELANPHFLPPVLSPRPSEQPGSARIEFEFRGATSFTGAAQVDAFDARALDPMGDVGAFEVQFLNGDSTWKSVPQELDGAAFIQMRISFINDIVAMVAPELSAVGLAYSMQE